jgi:hypothetical protein
MKTQDEAIAAASKLFDILDPEETRRMHITIRFSGGVRSLAVRHDHDFELPQRPPVWETLPVAYEVRPIR